MNNKKITRSINDANEELDKIKSIFEEITIELNK